MFEFEKHRSGNTAARDPEDRAILLNDQSQVREKMLDKTLADSFPASDPPSSTPPSGKGLIFTRITTKEEQTHGQHRTRR